MAGKTLAAIVGFQHRTKALGYDVEAFVRKQPDGRPLLLIREPQNPHDPHAVQVWIDGVHVGYIKGTQVRPVAMAMDSGRIGQRGARYPEQASGSSSDAPPTEPAEPTLYANAPAKLSTRNGERYPFVEIDL